MPPLSLGSPELERFAYAPSFALGEDRALQEYEKDIPFESVFSFVKRHLNFKHRTDLTSRALKLALPRISVDHGGDRIMQEVVQKLRRVCSPDDNTTIDIGLIDFKQRFEAWQRGPSKCRIRMMRLLRRYKPPTTPRDRPPPVVSSTVIPHHHGTFDDAAAPAAAVDEEPDLPAQDDVASSVLVELQEAAGAICKADDDPAEASRDGSADVATPVDNHIDTDHLYHPSSSLTTSPPGGDDAAPSAASPENPSSPPAAAAGKKKKRTRRSTRQRSSKKRLTTAGGGGLCAVAVSSARASDNITGQCAVCNHARVFERAADTKQPLCTACGNTFKYAGIDTPQRTLRPARKGIVLYHLKRYPGFDTFPQLHVVLNEDADIDGLANPKRHKNTQWKQGLPNQFLHKPKTMNQSVLAVKTNDPNATGNGVNAFRELMIWDKNKFTVIDTMRTSQGGPGFASFVEPLT